MSENLYIVDNSTAKQNETSEPNTVKKYLMKWCGISKQMDIATGYFEIGGLLELDGRWQNVSTIRIILGDEVTKRTEEVIKKAVARMKDSLDDAADKQDFLPGVSAIIDAISTGKIQCRVYDHGKFHAKAYITYFNDDKIKELQSIPGLCRNTTNMTGFALVGSSNFTKPGLTQNIELNIQIQNNVEELQNWFERFWKAGKDITDAVLKVIQNYSKEYINPGSSPYDVYLRSMYEYFNRHETTVSEWENYESIIYRQLAQYQKDGYARMVNIASRYKGAFCCDGVGLGKTFIGLMLIERFVIKERKNVVLIVPASARFSVWETVIKQYLPGILAKDYPLFQIINHTDLALKKNNEQLERITDKTEIIIIDEAHNFRNNISKRYQKLADIMRNGMEKQLFMLTATPINNSYLDLQHLIELFTKGEDGYFKDDGVHSLAGHFQWLETDAEISAGVFLNQNFPPDATRIKELLRRLVIQRSRAYVQQSLKAEEGVSVLFSIRQPPRVANYSLKESYGHLLDVFCNSFNRHTSNERTVNILSLAVYSPDNYYIGAEEVNGRDKNKQAQTQIVKLIRLLLLKRFESSIAAFTDTCIRIYERLCKFCKDYQDYACETAIDDFWESQKNIEAYIKSYLAENGTSLEEYDDDLPAFIWEDNSSINVTVTDFNIQAMVEDTIDDLRVLGSFIEEIMKLKPENDDKIRILKDLLKNDPHLAGRKVIIFSEYRSTAKYIEKMLKKAGYKNLYEIDGQSTDTKDRHDIIQRFAPYYNGLSSGEIDNEIQILVATDVLAEGLNLQDASCLINYELHWNPVRLMQRIGRIDRRRDKKIEDRLLTDHPELADDRANAYFWNFLPPNDLEKLLNLYTIVSTKTLLISKAFGIEGKKLLTPEDNYEALKNFDEKAWEDFQANYDGVPSSEEEIALAYQQLMEENPKYEELVSCLPKKMFSGKISSSFRGYFFCYELPTKRADGSWTEGNGDGVYRWYLWNEETGDITYDISQIWPEIQCSRDEKRVVNSTAEDFEPIRKRIENYIRDNYMKQVGALGKLLKCIRLVTWMQFVKEA